MVSVTARDTLSKSPWPYRHLSAAPFDKDLVCSCYGKVENGRSQVQCGLWRLGGEEGGALEGVATLQHEGSFRW